MQPTLVKLKMELVSKTFLQIKLTIIAKCFTSLTLIVIFVSLKSILSPLSSSALFQACNFPFQPSSDSLASA